LNDEQANVASAATEHFHDCFSRLAGTEARSLVAGAAEV
jgi:hypothetical protein